MTDALATPRDAEHTIRATMPHWDTESIALSAAAGLLLREDVTAERDQPPFDRVMMDGVAISSAAVLTGTRSFRRIGIQAAGARPLVLSSMDQCIEVMTGAVLPQGADCVVPVETLKIEGDTVILGDGASPAPGGHVHPQGSDARSGTVLLASGTRLEPPDIAIAASAGRARVIVSRTPRIMVISTGDELIEPGEPIEPWQIRRSNVYAVIAALQRQGYAQTSQDHLPDNIDVLRVRLRSHLDTHDVLILSGGVSMGRFDHIPGVLQELGVTRRIQRVAQRPGKPFWYGTGPGRQAVFALPGNPVSTLACVARYVLPALNDASGAQVYQPTMAALTRPYSSDTRLTALLPCTLGVDPDGLCRATLQPPGSSGDLVSIRGTQGFAQIAPGPREEPEGSIVPVYRC